MTTNDCPRCRPLSKWRTPGDVMTPPRGICEACRQRATIAALTSHAPPLLAPMPSHIDHATGERVPELLPPITVADHAEKLKADQIAATLDNLLRLLQEQTGGFILASRMGRTPIVVSGGDIAGLVRAVNQHPYG